MHKKEMPFWWIEYVAMSKKLFPAVKPSPKQRCLIIRIANRIRRRAPILGMVERWEKQRIKNAMEIMIDKEDKG